MKISIEKLELTKLVEKQLNNFFDISKTEKNLIYKNINKVLLKTEYCFSKSKKEFIFYNSSKSTGLFQPTLDFSFHHYETINMILPLFVPQLNVSAGIILVFSLYW